MIEEQVFVVKFGLVPLYQQSRTATRLSVPMREKPLGASYLPLLSWYDNIFSCTITNL